MRKFEESIDFVVPWVNGEDPHWLDGKNRYLLEEDSDLNRNNARYRDWGILKYWFRSVERYAPWVRTIHFVTCGHYPDWLRLEHPKLHFVKHEDYIPHEFLPTFNSHTIELNMHRIEGLSEHFVYFNDDVFLVADVQPTFFFKNGLPRDIAIRSFPMLYEIGFINMNDINIINKEFGFRQLYKLHYWKWMNYRYGFNALRNLIFIPYDDFTGCKNAHVANAYRKSTLCEVWEKYGKELRETCLRRFRSKQDINQWVFKYWQVVSGSFFPQKYSYGKSYSIEDVEIWSQMLRQKRTKLICINDNGWNDEKGQLKKRVVGAFQEVFSQKSSFER